MLYGSMKGNVNEGSVKDKVDEGVECNIDGGV